LIYNQDTIDIFMIAFCNDSDLSPRGHRKPHPLFIAEGLETAISLKEAGLQSTIKASLGVERKRKISHVKKMHSAFPQSVF
jgi:hypothetical protein